jgi:hypothetical protein
MRRLKCLFRRHDWHSSYDHERGRTEWKCSRCGAFKVTYSGINPNRKHLDPGMGPL